MLCFSIITSLGSSALCFVYFDMNDHRFARNAYTRLSWRHCSAIALLSSAHASLCLRSLRCARIISRFCLAAVCIGLSYLSSSRLLSCIVVIMHT